MEPSKAKICDLVLESRLDQSIDGKPMLIGRFQSNLIELTIALASNLKRLWFPVILPVSVEVELKLNDITTTAGQVEEVKELMTNPH